MTAPHESRVLADRIRHIRLDLFGEHGAPELARRLGLPTRTWLNYESGVAIPGRVLLKFLIVTNAEPSWLLGEAGPVYRQSSRIPGRD